MGDDARRKILVGTLVLSKLDDPDLGARFRTLLSREDDQALFPDLLAPQSRLTDSGSDPGCSA